MKPIMPTEFPWKDYRKYTYPLGLDLGPITYLSGHTASEYDPQLDKVTAHGGLREQLELTIEKIRVILDTAGYELRDIASVSHFPVGSIMDEFAVVENVLRNHGIVNAVHHVFPVDRLVRRESLLELEVVASHDNEEMVVDSLGAIHQRRVLSGHQSFRFTGAMLDDLPGSVSTNVPLLEQVRTITESLSMAGSTWKSVARMKLLVPTTHLEDVVRAADEVRDALDDVDVVPAIGVAPMQGMSHGPRLVVEALGDTAQPNGFDDVSVRRAGPFIFVTGLTAKSQLGSDLVSQSLEIYAERLPLLLGRCGLDMSRLLQSVEWIIGDELPNYHATSSVRRQHLSEPFPVAAGLVCSVLDRPGASLAVDAVAFDKVEGPEWL